MNIQTNKRNNKVYYYLTKSVREKGAKYPKKKIVESLGTREELIAKHGKDIDKWLKDYAQKRTLEDKQKHQKISIKQSKLSNSKPSIKNIGFIFIDLLCKSLGLDKICKKIEGEEKVNFCMYDVLLAIISRDILDDSVNKNLLAFAENFYNSPKFSKSNITKTIKLICKHNVFIQKQLYKNAYKDNSNDSSCLFYDCTNYGTIGATLEKLKYNKRYSDNITLGKIFMDKNLIPCGFIVENDLLDLKDSNTDILKNIKYRFKDAKLYALPYCLESKTDSSIYRRFTDYQRIDFCSVKNFDKKTLDFCLNPNDWDSLFFHQKNNIDKLENLLRSDEITREEFSKIFSNVYYKSKDYDNKKLFVFFSFETKYWLKEFRHYQLKRYQQSIEDKLAVVNKTALDRVDDKYTFVKSEIKDDEEKIQFFDDTSFREDEKFDGFITLLEDLDIDVLHNVAGAVIKKYNECDFFFEIFRTECYQNKDLTFKESLISHFLLSYLSYFVLRFMEYKLEDEFWYIDIISQLRNMNIFKVDSNYWSPTYNFTNLLKKLSKMFNLKINYNLISDEMLKY